MQDVGERAERHGWGPPLDGPQRRPRHAGALREQRLGHPPAPPREVHVLTQYGESPLHRRVDLGVHCPFCSNYCASVTNSLARLAPSIAASWHPTKNGELTPRDVTAVTTRKVWWTCPEGPDHEWQAMVCSRYRDGHGCPMCRGFAVSLTNSLATQHPKLARQWHPTKNGKLTPHDLTSVWDRTSGKGNCPFCIGHRPSSTRSLAAVYPELATEWHPTKNGKLTPHDLTFGSTKQVWWQCRFDPSHVWRTNPNARTSGGTDCRFCAGRRKASKPRRIRRKSWS